MALDLTALNDFNNEVAGPLLAKLVYGGSTMEYITVKEGVKYQEPINLMEVDLQLQSGTCVSTPSGSLTYTQRNITVCPRTSFDGLCLKDMDRTYLGIAALSPGSYNETFTMASTYSELLVNQFQKKNDQFIWSGDQAGCNAAYGLKTIISGSTTGVVVAGTGAATLANLDTMIAASPSDVADRDDLTFFMSVSKFREFIADLRTANNFYFDMNSVSNRGGILETQYPYQNIKVVGTVGLNGSSRIVLDPSDRDWETEFISK